MKICCVADTHCADLEELNLPDADILIHAGDWTFRGDVKEVAQFNEYCGKVKDKFKHGIHIVPGNHDWLAQKQLHLCKDMLANCHMVTHEVVEIEGKRFWFCPYTLFFNDWAFNEYEARLKDIYGMIPEGIDVLVTHGPPYGILDEVCRDFKQTFLGSHALLDQVQLVKPRFHVFGHIHSGYGMKRVADTTFINAAVHNNHYQLVNLPIVIEI